LESDLRRSLLVSPWLLLAALACGDTDARAVARAEAPSSVVPVKLGSPELAAASSGSFVALTYNIAGLPELLSRSRPSLYTPLIGKRLNGYDLVLLQESWQTPDPNPAAPLRCYHELLLSTAQHAYKSPAAPQPFGGDPRRPSAILADGLHVFSKLPLATTQRVPWARCVNTMNDCYALKGFSMTPVQLASGVAVHIYNLHMEAGRSAEDDAARDAAIDQLLAFIDQHSRGQALIVGGDFNLRGDRERTAAQLAKLRRGSGLLDACAGCPRPHNIDKLLYRSSEHVKLEAEGWSLETHVFQTDTGAPLSDHAPLTARFTWSKRSRASGRVDE
jgi:endonuclease/exonuclease/phosphatase family metal-dependent hydrolase